MPSDLQATGIFRSMMASAAGLRALEYRERSLQLFEMAQEEADPKLRGNLQMLAAQYGELADSLSVPG